jgi:Icc-related predicted phosphoesterase
MTDFLIGIFFFCSAVLLPGQESLSIQHWEYVAGQENETLHEYVIPDFVQAEKVSLPHRLIRPNRIFWYRSEMVFSGSGFLMLRADDGAQVWVNGKRILTTDEGKYPFEYLSGKVVIIVRVLNNAVAGGLNGATLVYQNTKEKVGTNQSSVQPYCFTFWGDSQGGWETFSGFVDQIRTFGDSLTIGLGDLTANGRDKNQWEGFQKCVYPLTGNTELYTIPGNHDYDGYYDDLNPVMYKKYTGINRNEQTYGWFTTGKNVFMALDINRNFPLGIDDEQKKYLDSVALLPEWLQAEWRFVLVHQPPYGQGWKSYAGEEVVREWLEEVAEEYRIDFVLSGHIHDFERINKTFGKQKTACIVSGGAGGSMEPSASNPVPVMDKVIKKHHFCRLCLQQKEAQLTVYGKDGIILDQLTIKK